MAGISYPFQNDTVDAEEWGRMARLWQHNGVVAGVGSQLAVSISGSNAIVGSGACWLHGHLYHNDSTQSVGLQSGANFIFANVGTVPNSITMQRSSSAPAVSNKRQLLLAYISGSTLHDRRVWVGQSILTLLVGTGNTAIGTGTSPVGIPIPFDSRIVKWEVIGDRAGALTVSIQRTDYGSWPSSGTGILTTSISSGHTKGSSHPTTPANAPNVGLRVGHYLRTQVTLASTIRQAAISLYLAPLYVNG